MIRVFSLAAYVPVSLESVRDDLGSLRGNGKLIICGGLSGLVGTARSGSNGMLGQYGDKRMNEAEKLILKICKENNLFVANTMFDHKQLHESEPKEKVWLIYFKWVGGCLGQCTRGQVMDTQVFRGSDLGTDDYLVVARIRGLFTGAGSFKTHRLERNIKKESPRNQTAENLKKGNEIYNIFHYATY